VRKKAPEWPAFGQERLLDLRRDPHLLLHLRLLHRLAIETGVFDRDRRFGGRAFSSAPRVEPERKDPFSRLSRYSTPMRRSPATRRPAVDVAHELQRHALDVADAERDGAHVDVGQLAVEQVGEDLRLARCGTLPRESCGSVAKLVPGQRLLPRPRASLNSSSCSAPASMMKPRSAPVTSIAESSTSASTSSSTRPLPSARRPSSSAAICRRSPMAVVVALSWAGAGVGEQEDQLGAARPSEPDAVAVDQRALGDWLVVDVGAVARLLVANDEAAVVGHDLGVVARDLAAGQAQIVGLAPADAERVLADRHDAPAERVGDLQACVWHFEGSLSNAEDETERRQRADQRR
jgi:hypothetical protein